MDLQLNGKRVLVTGGSRGIGRKICETFIAEGAKVAFCSRNAEQAAETAKTIGAEGASVDIADGPALKTWVEETAGHFGGIDYVVANASAISIGASDESWRKEYEVDILGTQRFLDASLPYLTESAAKSGDAGAVVISSVSAAEASSPDAYGAAKAALIHIVKGMARQQAPNKVRVNAVSPGTIYFEGGVWNMIEENAPEIFKQAMSRNPMGRMGTMEEIANATVFLCSPCSTFTTGANLVVDGAITSRVNY